MWNRFRRLGVGLYCCPLLCRFINYHLLTHGLVHTSRVPLPVHDKLKSALVVGFWLLVLNVVAYHFARVVDRGIQRRVLAFNQPEGKTTGSAPSDK